MSMARSLMANDRMAAARLLREIAAAAPTRGEAGALLSREFGQ
jgi:hypothetical protein